MSKYTNFDNAITCYITMENVSEANHCFRYISFPNILRKQAEDYAKMVILLPQILVEPIYISNILEYPIYIKINYLHDVKNRENVQNLRQFSSLSY